MEQMHIMSGRRWSTTTSPRAHGPLVENRARVGWPTQKALGHFVWEESQHQGAWRALCYVNRYIINTLWWWLHWRTWAVSQFNSELCRVNLEWCSWAPVGERLLTFLPRCIVGNVGHNCVEAYWIFNASVTYLQCKVSSLRGFLLFTSLLSSPSGFEKLVCVLGIM